MTDAETLSFPQTLRKKAEELLEEVLKIDRANEDQTVRLQVTA
jgi:hypothetical protein